MATFNANAYYNTLESAKEDIVNELRRDNTLDIDDLIREVADNHIPLYNHDIMMMLLADGVDYEFTDSGLAEGCSDILKLAQMRIYEQLTDDLYQDYEEFEEIANESDEEDEEEDEEEE